MRLVLDNSVAMRWLFLDGSDADLAYAEQVLGLLERDGGEARVPSLWPLEVANVVARAEARGWLEERRSYEFLGLLERMPIEVDPQTSARALHETLQLARRFGLSAYDASYLELALRSGLPLATLDQPLRKAAGEIGAALVEV